ncbi:hypothetical protein ACLMJK_000099 [Lecanora helva]
MDERSRDENRSIMNGMEHVTISHHSGDEIALSRSRTHRLDGALKKKNNAWVDFSNKTLAPEQTDFMIQQLEKKTNPRLQRTYTNGLALEEVESSAPIISVGLKFLRGADTPQVTRGEQIDMEGKEADQKDALWRVATAGALLSQFNVTPDLQIVKTDDTANIVARAKYQAHSDRVRIVKDLRTGDWDLRGLLVEVDWKSLWDLMVNYQNLIAGGGPEMTFEETRELLDTMIEDARRLCIRSPILFRMSTRVSIINSENTRYGINHGGMFRTLTTSKGIKEIISLSSAYFNSLDPTGSDPVARKYIRPKFLQMIVLLLSLLNNEDLAEIKDFLEATYKLKADRRDIELLILKVIPLSSINPRVFLNALVPAIDGFPLQSGNTNKDGDHSHIWNIFIKRILENGYILPGTVDDLGRNCLSWIVKWPEDGFISTVVFDNLQYAGRLRTINDIPPVEVRPGSNCTELTVVMTDDSKYVISPGDLDNIIYMTPGSYPVQETDRRKRYHDLTIRDTLLNGELFEAIKMINGIVHTVNQWIANPRKSGNMVTRLVRQKSDHQAFLNDVEGSGRLEEVVATLNHSTLAVAYKIKGRKVSRNDAVQTMARDIRHLHAFINHVERRGDLNDHGFFSMEKRELKQSLERVRAQINLAEQRRARIGIDEELSDEPIAKCLYPEGVDINDGDVWNGYKAWCTERDGFLNVEAARSTIIPVRWLTGDVIELSLDRRPSKVFVTPLKPVAEGHRDDEARVGDIVVLLGQYVAVGEPNDINARADEAGSMINYLRIVNMEEQNQSRRGRNRIQESDGRVLYRFK